VKSRPLWKEMCVSGTCCFEGGLSVGLCLVWFDLPDEPEEAFGCGVLAGLELIADEVLEGVGLERSGELAVGDFLSRRIHVNLVVPSIIGEAR